VSNEAQILYTKVTSGSADCIISRVTVSVNYEYEWEVVQNYITATSLSMPSGWKIVLFSWEAKTAALKH